jgi:membrane protein implicated in regulation of membrane protease activity
VKRLRWEAPERDRRPPKHPYRDTALVYGFLAALVVVIALATGGGLARALITAAAVFVAATLWSWRLWRNRLRDERVRREEGGQ